MWGGGYFYCVVAAFTGSYVEVQNSQTSCSNDSVVSTFTNFCPAGLKDVILKMEIHSILKAISSEIDLAEIKLIR